MVIRRPDDIHWSEITPESRYWSRREWLRAAGLGATALVLPVRPSVLLPVVQDDLKPNSYEDIT